MCDTSYKTQCADLHLIRNKTQRAAALQDSASRFVNRNSYSSAVGAETRSQIEIGIIITLFLQDWHVNCQGEKNINSFTDDNWS